MPTAWSHTGAFARAIARRRSTARPLLVLSMPRSGSSWVGATLGQAPNAAYLREPLTQDWAQVRRKPAVLEIDPLEPPASYRRDADLAFAGIPRFPPVVVRDRAQWHPWSTGRRVVVKEVNPFALRWLVGAYHPQVIYLVRHPAPVAESMLRRPWQVGYGELFLPSRRATGELREAEVGADVRTRLGAVQALAVREVLSVLSDLGDDATVLSYEDLCADPVGRFQELFAAVGLDWTSAVEAAVRAHSASDDADPKGLFRDSRVMADRWRTELDHEQVEAVRRGYLLFDPPLYGADSW